MTVGCAPHPAGQKRWSCKVSGADIRDDCRQTFAQWGLPDALRTDHDKVLVPSGEHPLPSVFTLWLVGLGVRHSLIQRVTQNGSLERCHRTFDKQMLSGCTATDWPTVRQSVAAELKRLPERVPSRAKACHGHIPLVAHPEAARRAVPLVGRGLRRASTHGPFKFADFVWNVGQRFENQSVVITFTADTHEFVVRTLDGTEIKRLPSDWINAAALRG